MKLTTTKQYDKLNRLTAISSARNSGAPPGPAAFTFNYQYNAANQRVRVNTSDGYWIYEYDKLGQVTSAKKFWFDGTPVAGQDWRVLLKGIRDKTGCAVCAYTDLGTCPSPGTLPGPRPGGTWECVY